MKILTIKKSREFQEIGKKGKKYHAKTMLVLQNPTPQIYLFDREKGQNARDFCRLGLTVSKKVGNAITRNKTKRRLRHAAREIFTNHAKNHNDYVIIAKKEIKDADFEKVLGDLKYCLSKLNSLN